MCFAAYTLHRWPDRAPQDAKLWKYVRYATALSLPCHKRRYDHETCPFCGHRAYSHRYDAAHIPWLVYGYEWHCHTCGAWYIKRLELALENQYIREIRAKTLEEAIWSTVST